jgi:hypothetical protein
MNFNQLLALVLLAIFLAVVKTALGRELYPGQFAQVPKEERDWFKSQKAPNSSVPCCDESDGIYAEEELRGDKYWTQFVWKRCIYQGRVVMPADLIGIECSEAPSGWMEVPDDVVIRNPNRHGAPVVWWRIDRQQLSIRCYVPGGGV